jgi:D-alanyl-D-alanine carboxypeptidase
MRRPRTRRPPIRLLVPVCALAILAGSAPAARAPTPLQRALRAVVEFGAPGATVLVRDGARTTQLAVGYARLTPRTPLRAGDRFRIGSVTKSFVATVVLQLAGEGRLTLDDPLERWLPGIVPNSERITLRHLLTHTSGIYNYTDDPSFTRALRKNPRRVLAPADLVRIATAQPAREPGEWSYSNTNYILLGLVVETVTGRPLAEELRSRILEPLGLRDTSLPATPAIPGRHAHGYTVRGGRRMDVTAFSPSWAWAAGGMVSTSRDLATFYGALLTGQLLAPPLQQELLRLVPTAGYASGIARARLRCGYAWGHDGLVPGYYTAAWTSTNGRKQVVVLINTDTSGLNQLALLDLLNTAYCRPR